MRATRRAAEAVLRAPTDFEERLGEWLASVPPGRAVAPLVALLCSDEEPVKWRAVRALGAAVSRLASADLEAARGVVRRLAWSLADEAGAIGWGAPEAMGEILAAHAGLASEFAHLLASYLADDAVRDNAVLLRGAVWGVGRLAEASPERVAACAPRLEALLASADAELRDVAAWALRRVRPEGAVTAAAAPDAPAAPAGTRSRRS